MAWNNNSKWECGSIPGRSVNPNQQPHCIRVSYYDYCGHSPYRNLEDKNKNDVSHLLANTLPLHYYSWDKSLRWMGGWISKGARVTIHNYIDLTLKFCYLYTVRLFTAYWDESCATSISGYLNIKLPKCAIVMDSPSKPHHSKHIQMYKARHKQNSVGPSHTGQDTD